MILFFVFLALALAAAFCGAALIFLLLLRVTSAIRKRPGDKYPRRIRRMALALCVLLGANTLLVTLSQQSAATPKIRDERGEPMEGAIAALTQVTLNGRKQWISLRGQNAENPVLLFLAGGPGGSQMAAVRHDLARLEQDFVVASWDQPGAGKSYYAQKLSGLTVQTYIDDGYALTNYLREAFGQEKILLVGESWGSALGIFLAARYPEAYHAFVGTGQMVAFLETERIDYETALELAKSKNDRNIIKKLEANGPPPYYGRDVVWKSAVYLNYLSARMAADPQIHHPGYNTLRDVFSREYGLLDQINYFRGIVRTYGHVYPQLYGTDLRTDYPRLEIPVYFFEGRHDLNAPPRLAEDYFQTLEAPVKEIVWFEHSGHSPWINESAGFAEALANRFAR